MITKKIHLKGSVGVSFHMGKHQDFSGGQHKEGLVFPWGWGWGKSTSVCPASGRGARFRCSSAEAGVVVVMEVREVEMYSDVNLHLKRQNVVIHLGGDLSFP